MTEYMIDDGNPGWAFGPYDSRRQAEGTIARVKAKIPGYGEKLEIVDLSVKSE